LIELLYGPKTFMLGNVHGRRDGELPDEGNVVLPPRNMTFLEQSLAGDASLLVFLNVICRRRSVISTRGGHEIGARDPVPATSYHTRLISLS
jgi:hypothetical protein